MIETYTKVLLPKVCNDITYSGFTIKSIKLNKINLYSHKDDMLVYQDMDTY